MRILLGAASYLVLAKAMVFACSCSMSSTCPTLGRTGSPVFVGSVIEVTDAGFQSGNKFLSSRKVRLRVTEHFGGLAPEQSEVEVWTGRGGGDCGIAFEAGETWLIDAFASEDGAFHTGICSFTRRIDAVGAALQLLRKRRSGEALPSLAGQIVRSRRDFKGPISTEPAKPLADAVVRVGSEHGSRETRADAHGLYAFYDLPGGTYQFAPDLPAGTRLSWYIGSDKPQTPFTLRASSCEERDIEVFDGGSIEGRVLDSSGNPLPYASVYILPAALRELPDERHLYWDGQGTDGFFRFVHIPPGEYLVLVNPKDSPDARFPYRRTFHPGVHERSQATVITVRAGEQVRNADIRVQQEFAPRHLRVRVTWSDGSPVRHFAYIAAKGFSRPELTSDASTDARAPVAALKVDSGEPYEVWARVTCRYYDERTYGPGATFESAKVHVRPNDRQTELTLIVPAEGCPAIPGKTLDRDQ